MQVGIFGRDTRPEVAAVAAGFSRLGWEPVFQRPQVSNPGEPFDAVVVVGTRLKSGEFRDHYRARGVPVLVLDLPPIRKPGYWALWPGEVNVIPESAPQDRLSMVNLATRRGGSAVLVAGQKANDAAHRLDRPALERYFDKVVWMLRGKLGPERRIIWRHHPEEPLRIGHGVETSDPEREPIEAVLDDPELGSVVTLNSTVGLAALERGLPVYCDRVSFYAGAAFTDLPGDERFPDPVAVRDLFARLTYVQWTEAELETGRPQELTLARFKETRWPS